jgi:Tfp pilus assembly protein PilV
MRLANRPGLSLLEVILSLAILLFSITAIAQLIRLGSERAVDTDDQAIATTLCQRKLTELQIGIETLGPTDYAPFTESGWEEWEWKAQVDPADAGTYNVQVNVRHQRQDGSSFETQLAQIIVDPSVRGSNQDPPANPPPGSNSNSNSSTTPSSNTPSTNTPTTNTPATTTPAKTGSTTTKGN